MITPDGGESAAAPEVRPVVAANKLMKAGDYAQAKTALETADLRSDDTAAMLYVMVLDKMGAQAEKQRAVEMLIDGLGPKPACSDTLLTYLMRQAQRACLDSAPIEKLIAAAERRDDASGDLEMVLKAVKRRHHFRMRQGPRVAHLNFISLGIQCLPWTLLNRWGLRNRAQFVHDFSPFSLATHRIRGVMEAMENDFATYMAPDEIIVEDVGKKDQYAMRRDKSAQWGHNQGIYWTRNEFQALRDVMQVKIENFRQSCRAETPVFIITGPPTDADEIDYLPRLRKALHRFTGNENDYIIITALKVKRSGVFRVDDHAFQFFCPMPGEDYRWWRLDTADSAEGLEFERNYLKYTLQCLRRWKLLKPPLAGADEED